MELSTLEFAISENINTEALKQARLRLFKELPDPNYGLFPQPCDNLHLFTLFPKLPLELRQKVWRFGFPKPRSILLDSSYSLAGPRARQRRGNRHTPLPLTL
ncbi:hypothetical protein BDZ45DRAFT_750422 [Acephala macrosclerotiorum]|nr:hypothetical protein BDZ45DRAFT_750422 [Acephala macrosclerotiorum]